MVTGVVESNVDAAVYPELVGARVLITGLESGHGVDIARAFAEAGCRLVLQTPTLDPELDVVLEILAQEAPEVKVSSEPIISEDAALKFAQGAVAAYGGLDIVINLARLDAAAMSNASSDDDIEACLSQTLGRPLKVTQVIANRMQLTWKEGLILNIVTQGGPATPAGQFVGRIARATLAAVTRKEAERWAGKAIRINAIVPADGDYFDPDSTEQCLRSEPEIAAVALHLASNRGKSISGVLFDAGQAN
jgi:NAD(P)-dependent dehydrogenase (short-subunit alcohol dehydrogenase family)